MAPKVLPKNKTRWKRFFAALPFRDRWEERRYRRESQQLAKRHASLVSAAHAAGDRKKVDEIYSEWARIKLRESEAERLYRQARRWLVRIPTLPPAIGVLDEDAQCWEQGPTGRWFLTMDAELEIRKAIRHERPETMKSWAPIVFGWLGWLVALVSVWRKL